MCKNSLKCIYSISIMLNIRNNILLNSDVSLPLPSAQILLSVYLSELRSFFCVCLSLNTYFKSISGRGIYRLPRRLTIKSCGNSILPMHLMRIQTHMKLLFSVWPQEQSYTRPRSCLAWDLSTGNRHGGSAWAVKVGTCGLERVQGGCPDVQGWDQKKQGTDVPELGKGCKE